MDKQAILEACRNHKEAVDFDRGRTIYISLKNLEHILAAHEGETFKYQEDINHDTKTIFVPPDRYFDLRGETDKQIAKRVIEEYMDATPAWAYLSLYDLIDWLEEQ